MLKDCDAWRSAGFAIVLQRGRWLIFRALLAIFTAVRFLWTRYGGDGFPQGFLHFNFPCQQILPFVD